MPILQSEVVQRLAVGESRIIRSNTKTATPKLWNIGLKHAVLVLQSSIFPYDASVIPLERTKGSSK